MGTTPIRILHMIASLEIGGSQAFVMNLYRNIDREKIQFDFIIDHTHDMYFQKEIESLGGKIFVLPTYRGYNLLEIKKAWHAFFKEHPEYKVLHSHSRSYASLYLPVAKKYGVKTIIHSHSTSNGKGAGALLKTELQYPLRYQADSFMACSKEAGVWLFGEKVCRGEKFQVVKNAIDAKKLIFNKDKRKSARAELGIGDEFTLGFLARVMPPKNPVFVIEVFSEIKKKDNKAKLLYVGDGVLLPKVKERARELGVEKDIIFTGARADVDNMLFAMDCYILPSLWEGLGISLIEAQASGIRCVCSENIQKEAIVTDLVKQMNLSEGAEVWAEEILCEPKRERDNCFEIIEKVGYDIESNARRIEDYYMTLA